jgi:hypothetical protein
MWVLGFRSVLYFLVAGKTQVGAFFDKQVVVLGGMRPMAGKTALLARDGRMGKIDFLLFVRMTAEAEFIPARQKELGILRRMGVMTLDAHPFFERRVLDGAAGLQILEHVALLTSSCFSANGFPEVGALWHMSQLAVTTGLCALALMSFGWSEE